MIEQAGTAEDPRLTKIHFTTMPWRAGDAWEVWQQRLSAFYDTKPLPNVFCAETSTWHLGAMIAQSARYAAREQSRTPRKIRGDQLDHYRLILQLEGTLRIDADGRRSLVKPGSTVLTDLARPKSYSLEDGANVSVFIPREVLDRALPKPFDLHGFIPQGAAAALLSRHVQGLIEHAGELRQSEAASVAQSTIQLVAASVAPLATRGELAPQPVESTLLRHARRYIEEHLTESDLTPALIGRILHLSRASVYRLFEPYGGVAAYIRERRLQHVHQNLSTPGARQRISTLAEAYRFSDASQLSHAFKQHFGYRPTEARTHLPVDTSAAELSTHTQVVLGDWLHALRDRGPRAACGCP